MTSPHDLRKADVLSEITDLFVLVRVKLWDLWMSREMTTACDVIANKLSVKTTLTLAVLNNLVAVAMTWSLLLGLQTLESVCALIHRLKAPTMRVRGTPYCMKETITTNIQTAKLNTELKGGELKNGVNKI